MTKKLRGSLANSIFSDSSIVDISALNIENIDRFIGTLKSMAYIPERKLNAPFLFAVDHCFAIKGQGTICTGTVLQGSVKINDDLEITKLKLTKKVKSMQMFREKILSASHGDRIGICITQFDSSLMERGLLSTPGLVVDVHAGVIKLNAVKYFKGSIKSRSKFHITCGYETVMADITLFKGAGPDFDPEFPYEFVEQIDFSEEKELENIFVLLEFEKVVQTVPKTSLVIASKLDMDIHANVCRLAFWGQLNFSLTDRNYAINFLPKLKIYKEKSKVGTVQRIVNEYELISDNLFKKTGGSRQKFLSLKVTLTTGQSAVIDSTFGQTSKVKLRLTEAISRDTKVKDLKVELRFKKLVFNKSANIWQ